MGNNRLFWSQETMDEWLVEEKATIKDDILVLQNEPIKYKLSQAVHFTADVGDGDDSLNLIGKVKELEKLEQMNAEHYMDSVIVEDSAYQVVTGFTGLPIPTKKSQARLDDITGAVKTQAGENKQEDRELLAKFLLDNL